MPIVNRSQGVISSAMHPKPEYSRVVTIGFSLPRPPGEMHAVSPKLGNRLILSSVDVWIDGGMAIVAAQYWFDLRRGLQMPASQLEIQQWDYLLPVFNPTGIWVFNGFGINVHRRWEMNVLYEGEGQRFAIIANMVGPVMAYVTASFQISEG